MGVSESQTMNCTFAIHVLPLMCILSNLVGKFIVADMEVDMVAEMDVDKVANMQVDMVTDRP